MQTYRIFIIFIKNNLTVQEMRGKEFGVKS